MTDRDNAIVKSLDKISGNLLTINNTIKEQKTTAKKIDEIAIPSLVTTIDRLDNELLKPGDVFSGWLALFSFSLLLVAIVSSIGAVLYSFINTVPWLDVLAVLVASGAIVAANFSFVAQMRDKNLLKVRYDRTKEMKEFSQKSEGEKMIIKALIKLKGRNADFSLETLSKLHPEMFTKERLLEFLYE